MTDDVAVDTEELRRPGVGAGLALTGVIAAGALLLERTFADRGIVGVSAVFVAIVLGLLARRVVPIARVLPGARMASGTVLKVGIVLLGVRFDLDGLRVVGGPGALAILAALTAATVVAWAVLRWQVLPRRLALLIAVGTAICGNSAIAAAAPVLGARDEEVSYASATITVFGMALVVGLPVLGGALGLTAQQFGILAGAGVHDSAQAIAAGFIVSDAAGEVATVTKLARTLALIPLLALLSMTEGGGPGGGRWALRRVPWFAVGFVLVSLLRTGIEASGVTSDAYQQGLAFLALTATTAILVAMAGVGFTTSVGDIRRIGVRPLLVGLAASIAVTTAAGLVAVRFG